MTPRTAELLLFELLLLCVFAILWVKIHHCDADLCQAMPQDMIEDRRTNIGLPLLGWWCCAGTCAGAGSV